MSYATFLDRKRSRFVGDGFDGDPSGWLYPFQRDIVELAYASPAHTFWPPAVLLLNERDTERGEAEA